MSVPYLVIPPTLSRLLILQSVLERTRMGLAGPGAKEFEAVVLWLGRVVSPTDARVEAAFRPRQIAYRTPDGLAVEIPVAEWTAIALRLPPGWFVLGKVHTHPGTAYHSEADAANPYLCHEGAVAITVPDFARAPLTDLDHCSVNVLRGHRWIELTPPEVRATCVILSEDSATDVQKLDASETTQGR